VPAIIVLVLTQLLSPWVKRVSLVSLRTLGGMSGEIQESLNNFKVIVAFNRLDYFREKFKEANENNYSASVTAGIASNTFTPIYTFASVVAQIIVISYGIYLIEHGSFTIGLLIASFSTSTTSITRFASWRASGRACSLHLRVSTALAKSLRSKVICR